MSEDFLNWRGIKALREAFSITSFIGLSTSRKVASHFENLWIRRIKIATRLRRIKTNKETNFARTSFIGFSISGKEAWHNENF